MASTRTMKSTAAALAGAAVVASGAYALGSQAGDGSAVAASGTASTTATATATGDRRGFDRGLGRADLGAAASTIGVSEERREVSAVFAGGGLLLLGGGLGAGLWRRGLIA